MDALNTKIKSILTEKTTKIRPENIKSGVNILGINGNVTELNGETKTVTPTTSQQTITPTGTGKNALTQVTVNGVTSAIDNNITAGNIKKDVTILGVTGNYQGTTPSGTLSITENGSYDVTNYASASVNVSSGGTLNAKLEHHGYGDQALKLAISEVNGFNCTDKNMQSMFSGCTNLIKVKNSTWSNCIGLSSTFSGCSNLTDIDLNLISIAYNCALNAVFTGCSKLAPKIDLSHWSGWIGVSSGQGLTAMFSGCTLVEEIDISNLGTCQQAPTINQMFYNCTHLITIKFPSNISLKNVSNTANSFSNMFYGCTNLDNNTLNAILGFLPTMTKVTTASYKTLARLGLTSEQATVCQTLSNWEAASAAGWTTGY